MDQAAHVQLLAEASGAELEYWPDQAARGLAGALGSPDLGWLSFQPLWGELLHTDPDLLS